MTKIPQNYSDLKGKVDKNTTDYGTLKAGVDKNTKNYETLNKKIDNIKPGTGLPAGDYVKKTDYDKDKGTYVKKTDYAADKNKLLSTDEYEKDKRDELALKKDLTGYTKKDELNTSVSTFLKSADVNNPLRGYVEQKNFKICHYHIFKIRMVQITLFVITQKSHTLMIR